MFPNWIYYFLGKKSGGEPTPPEPPTPTPLVMPVGTCFSNSTWNDFPEVFANADYSNITSFNSFLSQNTYLKNFILEESALQTTNNVTDCGVMFNSCSYLETVGLFDTSNVTTFRNMMSYCPLLKNIPVFNTSKVSDFANFITNCKILTNDSVDNILQMCINATSYNGTKTLAILGVNSIYDTIIPTLPHYQDFLDARLDY